MLILCENVQFAGVAALSSHLFGVGFGDYDRKFVPPDQRIVVTSVVRLILMILIYCYFLNVVVQNLPYSKEKLN